MDGHQRRCDSSSQGTENKPQRKRAFGGAAPAPYGTWGSEDTDKKSKFRCPSVFSALFFQEDFELVPLPSGGRIVTPVLYTVS
ncbi:protein diaphanous homolog 3 isoform X1 [Tachysurus ichikawai]